MLAFPCNQFGSQEPNSNAVIEAFAGTKALDFGTESDTCGGASCVGRSGRPAAHGDRGAVRTRAQSPPLDFTRAVSDRLLVVTGVHRWRERLPLPDVREVDG